MTGSSPRIYAVFCYEAWREKAPLPIFSMTTDETAHSWSFTPSEAIALQKRLAAGVVAAGRPPRLGLVAGIDLAFDKKSSLGFCAALVFSYPSLEPVEEAVVSGEMDFPYIPGLLSFREGPLIIRAYNMLVKKPDCIIFDGQGIAHPRRLGIASHLGLILGVPSIGCAKSKLYGAYEEPGVERGERTYLRGLGGDVLGIVLRTRRCVKPVFVSPGHLVGVDEAAEIVLSCAGKYRVPVPTRLADIRVGTYKKEVMGRCRL